MKSSSIYSLYAIFCFLFSFLLINQANTQCTEIDFQDFESGLGIWNDGGADAYRYIGTANSGQRSMRLRDNDGIASSIFTDPIDLSTALDAEIQFYFYPESMEVGEKLLLEVSTDGGNSFVVAKTYSSGSDFTNGSWYNPTAKFTSFSLTNNTVIRLRCDASSTTDKIYLDDISIIDCPGAVASLCTPGTACDDGDPCTLGDAFDDDCNCVGAVTDSDGDGVCDAFDICSAGDDNVDLNNNNIPDACDTVNTSGCNELSATDFESGLGIWNDGGSDAYLYAGVSNSGSKSMRLRDNDGVASSIFTNPIDLSSAVQPELFFSYFPQSMESGEKLLLEVSTDGGASFIIFKTWISGTDFSNNSWYNTSASFTSLNLTSNTVFRLRCDASSTTDKVYIDDISIVDCPGGSSSSSCTPGTACDDGDPCTVGEVFDNNCNCGAGVVVDSDNDGVCDAFDICSAGDDNVDLDNDGIPDACNESQDCAELSFTNFEGGLGIWNDGGIDAYLYSGVSKSGTKSMRLRDNDGIASSIFTNPLDLSAAADPEIQFSFYPESMELGEKLLLEVSLDGGSTFSIFKTWTSGTDFSNGIWVDATAKFTSLTLTSVTIIRLRCDASSTTDKVYIDDISILDCPDGSISSNCIVGEPCDDGDPCTIADMYDRSCNCIGTVVDSDSDGVCDIYDVCSNGDDNVDINGNGIPDACDAPCIQTNYENFETGLGIWNDGGANAERVQSNSAPGGMYSVELVDNTGGTSSIYTNPLNMVNVDNIEVSFSYMTVLFESAEKFALDVSLDGGNTYSVYREWIENVDFNNNQRKYETVNINGMTFNANTVIRFRSDASGWQDYVYIDNISIVACTYGSAIPFTSEDIKSNSPVGVDQAHVTGDIDKHIDRSSITFDVFPNPASDFIIVNTEMDEFSMNGEAEIMVSTITGQVVMTIKNKLEPSIKIDVSGLPKEQIYFISMSTEDRVSRAFKFLKM